MDTSGWRWIDGPPARLKLYGELALRGWDIPSRWAVDETGQCWMDAAHGATLHRVERATLLTALEDEGDEHSAAAVRALLGLPSMEPRWMQQARANGWRPPE